MPTFFTNHFLLDTDYIIGTIVSLLYSYDKLNNELITLCL